MGGLNLREASLHAPAAFIASSIHSKELVSRILGRPSQSTPHISQALNLLSTNSNCPEWLNLADIDVPLHQRHLSHAIDEALYHQLTSSAPSSRARALAISTALPHAGDWLNGIPSTALGLHLHDR